MPSPPRQPHRSSGARAPDVRSLADAVARAWHSTRNSASPEIALSTVAALALVAPPIGQISATAVLIAGLDTDQFREFLRRYWTIFVRARPDLLPAAWPLVAPWLGDNPADDATVDAARRVARVALDAGQLHLTGTLRRRDADVFGPLLVELRADGARLAAGQFYTPGPLADTLATVLLTNEIAPGQSVIDPALGTGGLFRAAAQALRARGLDPAGVLWVGGDIDAVAVACAAVNAVLWELGPQVVLGVGDTLAESWQTAAIAQRAEVLQIAGQLRAAAFAADVLGGVARLVDLATPPPAPDART
ncbi:N-6 DNA methylase [Frankia sp. R82]|uniref:N-6 DNA methylase n=1 Tax=Frankia sp. R82 TaxID=2950553 RepID=UPI00204303C5|nr:N-6 DNA methylase [Frankia sp. R82]MCM3883155.1 N-6 DNA methylase [Frankia sp. R82]